MATLEQIHNASVNSALQARTKAAALLACYDIQNEDVGTANHTERLAMANKTLSDEAYRTSVVDALMNSVSTNDDIASDMQNASDNDIKFVVNSQMTNIALNNPPA